MCGQIFFLIGVSFTLSISKREKWYLDISLKEYPCPPQKDSCSLVLRINFVVRRCPGIKILYHVKT